jgi:hypothetical protein
MPQRASHRRRQSGGAHPATDLMGPDNPVLALQRSAGNRAVTQLIAREPVRTGTVQIAGVGKIKVKGGNLEEWDGKGAPDTVELTSEKGKHSGKLEKLATARTKTDVTIMIAAAGKAGENLNVGGGTQLDISDARITGYSLADGVETWRITDFTNVKRTKITHTIGAG